MGEMTPLERGSLASPRGADQGGAAASGPKPLSGEDFGVVTGDTSRKRKDSGL